MSSLDWYAHKSVGDGLFWIQERFYESGNRANIWVIRGSHQDVVIDAGLGLRSLPDYIKANGLLGDDSQRKNPLLAIGTHVHFDHSGGLHQFQQVGVHKAEVDALANGDNFETVTWLSDREIVESPAPGWRARQYSVKAVQPTHILQDGDVINLGDRQLSVLHMPGHSRGSICLHDADNKLLFSGDVVYDGAMIDWLPHSHVDDYVRSCERLLALAEQEQVEQVLPGHFNTFGVKRLQRLASNYVAGAGTCHRLTASAIRSHHKPSLKMHEHTLSEHRSGKVMREGAKYENESASGFHLCPNCQFEDGVVQSISLDVDLQGCVIGYKKCPVCADCAPQEQMCQKCKAG